MATRIYTANDQANAVNLKHVATLPDAHTTVMAALGSALVWRGARTRGILSLALTLGGAEVLARSLAGKPLLDLLGIRSSLCSAKRSSNSPSFRDEGRPSTQEPEDFVEEASMESFPASDPPASHRSTQLPPPT